MKYFVNYGPQGEILLVRYSPDQPHKFGTTQVDIPYGPAAHGLENLRQMIPSEHLMGDGRDVGGNHVTVRYGLADDDHEELRSYISVQKPFEASLGSTIKFDPSEHSNGAAVIVAPIEAPELNRINAEIAQHATFRPSDFEYRPHATVAYVKPDNADTYVGCSMGQRFMVDSISIRSRDGKAEIVPLKGKPHGELGDVRYSPDQSRDKDGKFTMGNVATFKNEADGISAHVTSFNGKYHVHLMDDDSGQVLPQSSIHSGDGAKEKAVAHAKKLVDFT
jgi:2'-5' RNA ligase